MAKIRLTDDGTMDIVLQCSACREEFRFNWDGLGTWDAFVDWAVGDAEGEHECPRDSNLGEQIG